ncbi:hypothetical protein GCM10027610_144610 [Dactylosporangium cerinum]
MIADRLGADTYPDLAAFTEDVDAGRSLPDAVVLWAGLADDPTPDLAAQTRTRVDAVLRAAQTWLADDRYATLPLIVATSHAVTTAHVAPATDLAGAAVWGLLRTAQTENPGRILLVDLDDEQTSWDALAALPDDEPQLAVRAGTHHAPRLVRALPPTELTAPAGTDAWRLEVPGDAGGTLESIALVGSAAGDAPLAPGEVRIAVRAAGVNFRDVLLALGMYPEPGLMGSEGAGVVLEVGADVTDLAPGDRVFGLLFGGFGPRAVADHRVLARMPRGWTFARAASVPMAYLTAYYALRDLAGLRAGERLLVHAAAGGVGMSAVQLARHWGRGLRHRELRQVGHAARLRPRRRPHRLLAHPRVRGHLPRRHRRLRRRRRARLARRGLRRRVAAAAGAERPLHRDGQARCPRPRPGRHRPRRRAYRAFDLFEAGPARIREMLTDIVRLFDHDAVAALPSPPGTCAPPCPRSGTSARPSTWARTCSPSRPPRRAPS